MVLVCEGWFGFCCRDCCGLGLRFCACLVVCFLGCLGLFCCFALWVICFQVFEFSAFLVLLRRVCVCGLTSVLLFDVCLV